jgi:catechol 2,3-dioxygenase-like lactoylglutathione lyase family enzyme
MVQDVDANRRFWLALGGTTVRAGGEDAIQFPGLLVVVTKGNGSGSSEGSVLNHVAFRVRSLSMTLAALQAAGMRGELAPEFPGTGRAWTPGGDKLELFDVSSDYPRFTPDGAARDSDWERHSGPMTAPIVAQHLHFYLPEGADRDAKVWYLARFGGTPGKRLRYEAVDLPGINLNFSPAPAPAAPTRGRTLDHIGFEVTNLRELYRTFEAAGVRFDRPIQRDAHGVASAWLTDPWGTSIELTEGLRAR